MPPLLGLDPTPSPTLVPVIGIQGKRGKGKAGIRHPPRRLYGDDPLPVKPNTTAPKNASIVDREQTSYGDVVRYRLKIGEVGINDVSVDEILEYVSALELENFERRKFREEGEMLKALEEEQQAQKKAKLARATEKARNRGAVFVQEGSESDGLVAAAEPDSPVEEVQVGKHGRARPDYSKFYLQRGKGKGKVNDTIDQEMAGDSGEPSSSRAGAQQEVPHRRRRKRDPVSNELLPLEPLPSKEPEIELEGKVRRRRKRHPQTGELMPLGWIFDPEAEKNSYEKRRNGLGSSASEPSFKRLSIFDQHPSKRARLDTESTASSSASPVPTKAEIMGEAARQSTPRGGTLGKDVVDLMSSDDEMEGVVNTPKAAAKSPVRQAGNSMMRGTIDLSASVTDEEENSPEPAPTTSLTRLTATSPVASQRTPKAQQPQQQTKTSILSPSASRTIEPEDNLQDGSNESDDDEAGEGEWFIESILNHRMSDPKSHPPELGKQPVMLYSVKWEGYDSPTWEPMDSFGDRSFVDAYRKKVGLKALPREEEGHEDEEDEDARAAKLTLSAAKSQGAVSASKDKGVAETKATVASGPRSQSVAESDGEDEEGSDEDEYVFDKILSHHLSDPRTHPKALGKTPVMLYEVKWNGFEETTWEPEDSFEDNPGSLSAYKRRHGIR